MTRTDPGRHGTPLGWGPVLLRLAPLGLPVAVLFLGGLGLTVAQSLGALLPVPAGLSAAEAWATLLEPWALKAWALSLWVGLASALGSVALGVVLAWGLWRLPSRWQPLATIYKLPLILPHVAAGFIVLILFGQSGLAASVCHQLGLIAQPSEFPSLLYTPFGTGMILAYVFKQTPFVILLCLAALRRLDPQLETTAIMLGAGRWQRFRGIILPHCAPTLHTAFIILFLYAFGAFDIPWLLAGSSPGMLPVEVYTLYFQHDLADRPQAMALLAAMFLFSVGCIALYARLAHRVGWQERGL
ncbi:ABC transporter permease [Megalodesulfovibrio gigas]|uniref:Putative binding-protein-dependent transport system inner membrane protein n=1 Tax=Megalodesulfovibrio gigas (strain ATCC 19364 / DSM 1382 / NCIMB 9332 / VKM B-1759) TaxID=1121448 RepID=T2GDM8_MEGG1|nr:ABC transporter permease subunit [Megalodesulfovibrio gigas]AGW14221.1 putative binding-protein-dependent transport system inner membrane protein [Megalodesulfovibrio gigas DSM 1382 = ATCC 19364]